MRKLFENLKDWYLTRKTGKDRATREWEAWYEANVVYRASDIPNMFQHFKHVFIVDSQKFFKPAEPFAWIPTETAKEYFWPQRSLETTCVWRFERVMWDQWMEKWVINDMGGADTVFIATNSDEDATMLALLFS